MDRLQRISFSAALLLIPMAGMAADSPTSAKTPAATPPAAGTATKAPAVSEATPSSNPANSAAGTSSPAQGEKTVDKNPLNAMTPEQGFAKLDADGNGKITEKEAEVDKNLVKHFDKVAGDDTVDKTEYLAWLNSGTAGMSDTWPILNNTSGKPSYEDELPPARRMQPQASDPNMGDPAKPASAE